MPITTTLDKFRLELGDHPTVDVPEAEYVYLLNDAEAGYFIAKYPTTVSATVTAVMAAQGLLLAVADAAESLAARFAREMDFSEDGQNFRASQLHAQYKAMADQLRSRARRSTSMRVVSLVTPYSDAV